MAFVKKSGTRYQVRQGNTGKLLKSFSSKSKADEKVKSLHTKNKPKSINRGASASRARSKK